MREDRWLPDRSEASSGTRLIVESRNHLRGPGASDEIVLWRCVRGEPKVVYRRRFEYGLRLIAVRPHRVVLQAGLWLPGDSHATPSMQQQLTLAFDARRQQFRQIRRKVSARTD